MPRLKPIPSDRALLSRALRLYDASPEARDPGRAWYPLAGTLCAELAHDSGGAYSFEQVAAIVAVLSPRVHWANNLSDAHDMVICAIQEDYYGDWPTLHALGANIDKAAYILNGADPADIVRGPKVIPFWRALMGDTDSIVIDSWMMKVFGLKDDVPSPREHRAITKAIKRAAALRDETPAAMQAILWVAIRGSAR